jgi:hypothetical protein
MVRKGRYGSGGHPTAAPNLRTEQVRDEARVVVEVDDLSETRRGGFAHAEVEVGIVSESAQLGGYI